MTLITDSDFPHRKDKRALKAGGHAEQNRFAFLFACFLLGLQIVQQIFLGDKAIKFLA